MSVSHAGRFVWRELIAERVDAARAFYTELFGWELKAVPMPGFDYAMFHHAGLGEDIGGMMKPPMEGTPPHWATYITVDDVDAAVEEITRLGGTILAPPMSAPGVGRWAVVADPQGAVFCPFVGETPGATPDRRPPVGTFCWSQLMTRDLDAAAAFYGAITGWTKLPMGPGMIGFNHGEITRSSAMAIPDGAPFPPNWLNYVAVDDCDATFARAVALGAEVLAPPSTMEGMGRFAVLHDPAGAVFALWKDLGGES